MKKYLTLIVALLIAQTATAVPRSLDNLCVTRSGLIQIKNRCSRQETALTFSMLKGEKGDKGEPGTAQATSMSGVTIQGVAGASLGYLGPQTRAYTMSVVETFPTVLSAPPEKFVIARTPVVQTQCASPCKSNAMNPEDQALCPGTAENPEAAPGVLCFYPRYLVGMQEIYIHSEGIQGFEIEWRSTGEASEDPFVRFTGSWAYTIP